MEELEKIIARTLYFMPQSFFRQNFIFNNDVYCLDFREQIFSLIFFNINPFYHQKALHLGVLNCEKQDK